MSTIIYPSPIFGPVHSRRLGISLGINLLPADGKVCSFDCTYCECGFNADHRPRQKMPTREAVAQALEAKLMEMQQKGVKPDVLTFAGNGEPTMHPQFPDIVNDVRLLRDRYCPAARISVLTNATRIVRPEIHDSLLLVDNNIVKLDTVNADFIAAVDRPTGHYDVHQIVEAMKAFNGRCIVQTMFLEGSVSNTSEEYVAPWLDALSYILPHQVMIYTIDRETPDPTLRKAAPTTLDAIAERVRQLGIECSVAY